MPDLSLHISREKLGLRARSGPGSVTLIRSNRATLTLIDGAGKAGPTLTLRTHTLAAALGLAGQISRHFAQTGDLTRLVWPAAWRTAAGPYETSYDALSWAAVYHDGRAIFAAGDRQPVVDLIERGAGNDPDSYADALSAAEKISDLNGGPPLRLETQQHLAVALTGGLATGRAAVTLRGAPKSATFSFTLDAAGAGAAFPPTILIETTAALLESIQLCHTIGTDNATVRAQGSLGQQDGARAVAAQLRLAELTALVRQVEEGWRVRYRPERPDFTVLITAAERRAARRLTPA